MEEKSQIVSVSDFSQLVNTSVQAVYSRLEKDLKPYLKIRNGKKYIDTKGLEVYGIEMTQEEIRDTTATEQPTNKEYNKMYFEIEKLRQQLEEKAKENELLKDTIMQEKEEKKAYIERLNALTDRVMEQNIAYNEQVTNYQHLLAMQMQKSEPKRISLFSFFSKEKENKEN